MLLRTDDEFLINAYVVENPRAMSLSSNVTMPEQVNLFNKLRNQTRSNHMHLSINEEIGSNHVGHSAGY